MTREEMIKMRFKPYMIIAYQTNRMPLPVDCLLSAIDFDNELMTLTPLDGWWVNKEFDTPIQFCSLPKQKMKVAGQIRNKEEILKRMMGDGWIENLEDEIDPAS